MHQRVIQEKWYSNCIGMAQQCNGPGFVQKRYRHNVNCTGVELHWSECEVRNAIVRFHVQSSGFAPNRNQTTESTNCLPARACKFRVLLKEQKCFFDQVLKVFRLRWKVISSCRRLAQHINYNHYDHDYFYHHHIRDKYFTSWFFNISLIIYQFKHSNS